MPNPSFDSPEFDRLFEALCELPQPERGAFLDRHVEDREVRAELEGLLAHWDEATLDVGHAISGLGLEETPPQQMGQYAIERCLGSGGMGVVYLAHQEKPRRQVALKVMKGWSPDGEYARRFELEAELLGRLQHRGIAQIFESGSVGEGPEATSYLAMEYVEGRTLIEFAHEENLGQEARVRWLTDIAEAVHHAHARGVVHRDLKPNNILVGKDGQVKVIDFGIARATDREEGATVQTKSGHIVGTLGYMSPEQVRGQVDAIDTRADVYALGVLAYELLGGQLPLDLSNRSIAEIVRTVCDVDPPRLGSVSESCRGDLEWVVARALEKDPSRRYQSAASLGADFERYLNHQPIEARPASAIYQFRKIVRRHRAIAGGATMALLVALAIGVFTGLRIHQKNAELREERVKAVASATEAATQAELAQAIHDFLNDDLLAAVVPSSERGRGYSVSVREVLDVAAEKIDEASEEGQRFADKPLVEASIRATLGRTYFDLNEFDAAESQLERSLALYRQHRGENHEEWIPVQETLVSLLVEESRLEDARMYVQDLVDSTPPKDRAYSAREELLREIEDRIDG